MKRKMFASGGATSFAVAAKEERKKGRKRVKTQMWLVPHTAILVTIQSQTQ